MTDGIKISGRVAHLEDSDGNSITVNSQETIGDLAKGLRDRINSIYRTVHALEPRVAALEKHGQVVSGQSAEKEPDAPGQRNQNKGKH